MGYVLNFQRGNIRSGEYDYIFTPTRDVRRPAGKYGCVVVHGSGAPLEYVDVLAYESAKLAGHIAHAGIPVIGAEMSKQAWGNDASQTDIGNAITRLAAQTGAPSTKVCLVGVSMGGLTALRYAINNPTKVACVVGIIPLTNLVYMYENNVGGSQAEIATAWGVTAPAALPTNADIQSQADLLTVPTKLYYSGSDATIRPVDTTGFASAAGTPITPVNVGTLGHSEDTIGQVNDRASGSASEVIDFLKANGA